METEWNTDVRTRPSKAGQQPRFVVANPVGNGWGCGPSMEGKPWGDGSSRLLCT